MLLADINNSNSIKCDKKEEYRTRFWNFPILVRAVSSLGASIWSHLTNFCEYIR